MVVDDASEAWGREPDLYQIAGCRKTQVASLYIYIDIYGCIFIYVCMYVYMCIYNFRVNSRVCGGTSGMGLVQPNSRGRSRTFGRRNAETWLAARYLEKKTR